MIDGGIDNGISKTNLVARWVGGTGGRSYQINFVCWPVIEVVCILLLVFPFLFLTILYCISIFQHLREPLSSYMRCLNSTTTSFGEPLLPVLLARVSTAIYPLPLCCFRRRYLTYIYLLLLLLLYPSNSIQRLFWLLERR